MLRIKRFNILPISQLALLFLVSPNFPVSLTFESDPCETSLMSASQLKQVAMTILLLFLGTKAFHLSGLLYLVRLSWHFKT